jgi:hypothetical protein
MRSRRCKIYGCDGRPGVTGLLCPEHAAQVPELHLRPLLRLAGRPLDDPQRRAAFEAAVAAGDMLEVCRAKRTRRSPFSLADPS